MTYLVFGSAHYEAGGGSSELLLVTRDWAAARRFGEEYVRRSFHFSPAREAYISTEDARRRAREEGNWSTSDTMLVGDVAIAARPASLGVNAWAEVLHVAPGRVRASQLEVDPADPRSPRFCWSDWTEVPDD